MINTKCECFRTILHRIRMTVFRAQRSGTLANVALLSKVSWMTLVEADCLSRTRHVRMLTSSMPDPCFELEAVKHRTPSCNSILFVNDPEVDILDRDPGGCDVQYPLIAVIKAVIAD